MRYLKYILGAIALLLILFLAIGFISPSFSYDSEIEVNKSVEEAWAVMNDETKISEWLEGMTKMEHVSGEKGTVGAVTRYTYIENGQESTILETMKAIRPNEHVAMDFVMEGVMNMDYKMDFINKDGKALLKSSTTAEGDGMFMRSLLFFMKGNMQAQEDINMGHLKTLINNNTTDYFPEAEAVVDVME